MIEESFWDLRLRPWAIVPRALKTMTEAVAQNPMLGTLSAEQIFARMFGLGPNPSPRVAGRVAVISMYGVLGRGSLNEFTTSLRNALSNPGVSSIVFDMDSPGGGVDGVPELASEIYNARGRKKMVAVANCTAASAAYWIASAANEVSVTPSGQVGSIGVLAMHEDISKALEAEGVNVSLISAGKYKTEGSPYGPLSSDARAHLQSQVDEFNGMFVRDVARGRNVTSSRASNGFGEGRMVLSSAAVRAGMADRVETLDQTLARLGVSRGMPPARTVSVETLRRYLELC
jgi:signal peptide peptidase SppA